MSEATAKEKMRELATKAKEVVADEAKSLADKRTELDKIEADLKTYSDEVALHEQARRLVTGADSAPEVKSPEENADLRVKSLAGQLVASKAYEQVKNAMQSRGRFSISAEVGLKVANPVNEGTTIVNGFPSGQGGAAVIPEFLPGIVDLRFRKLVVADLMAQGATTSNQVSYVKETAFNNNAAGTAEQAQLPQSDDTIARVSEQVGKIGHFMKTTDELIQDAPAYESFLQNRLVFGVRLKEDGELLSGTGYPSVPGLLGRSGMQTNITVGTTASPAAPSGVIDDVYAQITAIRFNAFVEPDAILVNPTDWQKIRLAKDANGQYYAGGPFTGAYGNGGYSNVDALWGLRVLITPAIAAGSMLVGGYQECAQVFRRQGITVEMTNSNDLDFENGLITVRAEERLALAVYRPGGFGLVSPTW
ncbi:MAG TPA: phage major capsid protein [Mycobacteriales bacterium]|nr:phage major capsid protein [Mycobacteriales bacterium]